MTKVAILIIFSLITHSYAANRTKELCFLSDRRFKLVSFQKNLEKKQFSIIKTILPTTEKKDFDILLPQNKEKLNNFKRLYISDAYILFSQAHLDGIESFTKNGGLVVTLSGLCIIDKNEDFKYNKGDILLRKKGGIAGVIKFSGAKVSAIKPEVSCPLTKGLEEGKIIKINFVAGRVHNVSAEVIVSAKATYRQKSIFKNMPIVTYKKMNKGAIIFLDTPGPKQIFLNNALAPLTLEWLIE
jgi:hypothetical protein